MMPADLLVSHAGSRSVHKRAVGKAPFVLYLSRQHASSAICIIPSASRSIITSSPPLAAPRPPQRPCSSC